MIEKGIDLTISQLISEGSSKLASVPSGGSGGGSAPATGGAAAGGAAAEEKEEEKEEGMFDANGLWYRMAANKINREGRVRRGYGIRSFRLECLPNWELCYRIASIYGQCFWRRLCGLGLSFACYGSKGLEFSVFSYRSTMQS
jgi:hypothetical protein